MSRIKSFDLQFFGGLFGGTKTSTQRIPKRDPEPEELKNLRLGLYDKIYPGLQSFDAGSWDKAKDTANNALNQQNNLMNRLPGSYDQTNALLQELTNVTKTGNIPTGVSDRLNESVNKGLQSSMGNMLNGLANRGVVNSSITSQGVNNLSQAAADAYNRNYLSAYQSVIGGLGSALQGSQNNTASLLSGMSALGNIPAQAYEGVAAQLMPAFNLWSQWQNFYQNDDPYDTIVTQKQKSCITGDTLIRLKDGREIPVSELKDDDEIQAWDFETGKLTSAPLAAFFKGTSEEGRDIIRVEFEDGSKVGVIHEHLFFDMEAGKFVAINSDSQEFIGRTFAKVNANGEVIPVKVSRIYLDGKAHQTYGPQPEGHLNFLAGSLITGNDGQIGLINRFDFDVEHMTYDEAKRLSDLEKYGKLGYEDFKGIVSEEFYAKNKFAEFGVSIGKGLITLEQLQGYL
ncbi:MAG: hypothetical protein IJU48_07065, partial [Synergistaceae bacterium]|nr:hypothetical protein [Synergistaceae bacterium]